MLNKPHMPTLGATVAIILVVLVIYHFGFRKKQSNNRSNRKQKN